MDWRDRVESKPDVCHGQPCIRGTRIPLSLVLDNLASGLTPEAVTVSYPALSVEDVRAALAYAADLARERVVALGRTA